MELQGQQDVGVFAWKVNPGLKTGWGFMGCKMFSGLPEDGEVVRLERRAGAAFRMDFQDQQETDGGPVGRRGKSFHQDGASRAEGC